MKGLDLHIHEGDPGKPAYIFIHGLGMNSTIWMSPEDAQMAGGLISMRQLLKGMENKTLFHDVQALGATTACWSQRRPVGPVQEAVEELVHVAKEVRKLGSPGLVLVCHSRGGLIARAALKELGKLERADQDSSGLVTICTPHAGSGLAKWAKSLSPAANSLMDKLPSPSNYEGNKEDNKEDNGKLLRGINNMLGFITSTGTRELLPGSEFLTTLPGQPEMEGMRSFSIGGTDPALFRTHWLTVPERVSNLFPDGIIPDELVEGKGDGLVSAESSRLEGATSHKDFKQNHLCILTDKEVRNYFIELLRDNFGLGS